MAIFRPKNDKIGGERGGSERGGVGGGEGQVEGGFGGGFFFLKSFLIFGQTTPRNKKNDDTGSVDQF